ncbi:MAG: IS110 family transposase [Nitrososphaerales archaeon]
MTMTTIARTITGGVDTHLDVHVAAALDERGALLGVESFATTAPGYRALLHWLEGFGTVELVGVEGTGSYGAGLTRHLHREDIRVVEVDRPNRQRRRRKGKSDPEDAVAAARSAQGGDAQGAAKTRDGNVEAMRVLRVARSSARSSRTQAINQMRSLVSTAPEELRAELRDLSIYQVLELASAFRHTPRTDVTTVTKLTLRITLARRALALEEEVKEIDRLLKKLVAETAPELNAINGVGTDVASALLVAAGDNPERLKNEATFAKLCGVSPLDASSGKHVRHRLNRSGDRQANSALWHIVFTRMVCDPKTQHYIERRMKEGRTKKEAIRCLKRYVGREVFARLPRQQFVLDTLMPSSEIRRRAASTSSTWNMAM